MRTTMYELIVNTILYRFFVKPEADRVDVYTYERFHNLEREWTVPKGKERLSYAKGRKLYHQLKSANATPFWNLAS